MGLIATDLPTWSFSTLKSFNTCPKQLYETKIAKNYRQEKHHSADYGDALHKAAEYYVKDGTPLPKEFRFMEQLLERLLNLPGDKYPEYTMALDTDFNPVDIASPEAWWRGISDLTIIDGDEARILDYKGLDVDTPIPTPNGFVRMGDISVGDLVFDKEGVPCNIIGKSQVKNLPCYRVTFTDGSNVVCDEEHLWALDDTSTVNVLDLKKGARIPTAMPLHLEEKDLPIHPYVLGIWIADGKNSSGEVSNPESEVWEYIESCGYNVNRTSVLEGKCPTYTIQGIRGPLNALGLLGKRNKRIPNEYLQSSFWQRVELLRGLMDGDGSANPLRKQCIYCTTGEDLSNDVRRLLCSLGQTPYVSPAKAFGFGKHTTSFNVCFRPRLFNPFGLTRKRDKATGWGPGESDFRKVKSVIEVPLRPTQCIAVDSPSNTYLCTKDMIVTHNSGNDKYADKGQLELMALGTWRHFPQVKRVRAGLLFVTKNNFIKQDYHIDEESKLWEKWLVKYKAYARAHKLGVWNPKPSGLCRRHCPVESCAHYGG